MTDDVNADSVSFSETMPYAHAALVYFDLGWEPLPIDGKFPPPRGRTGKNGTPPQRNEVEYWVQDPVRSAKNIALRLPRGVIGVDVDAYDEKHGRETLAELEKTRGTLPDTWVCGSRNDNISGIRFYRVPEEWQSPSVFGDGIECISWDYRYAVAWPSIHPKTFMRYTWRRLPGWVTCTPPAVSDLPALPDSWLSDWKLRSSSSSSNGSWNGSPAGSVDIDEMVQNGAGSHGDTQRHDLLRLTQKMAGLKFSETMALTIWRAVLSATPQDPADPWTDDHFYDFFNSAQKRVDENSNSHLVLPSATLQRWAQDASQTVNGHTPPPLRMNEDDNGDDSGNGIADGAGNGGGNDNGDDNREVSLEWLNINYTCDHFGMAEFFIDEHGSRIRWDSQSQLFMVYSPEHGRWLKDTGRHEIVTRMVRSLAKAVNRAAESQITAADIISLSGANGRQQQEEARRRVDNLRRWYHVFKGTGNTYSVVSAIQPTAAPCRMENFNRQPYLLNFTNGTYNVMTGELQPHNPDDMISHQIDMPLNLELASQPLEKVAPYFSALIKRMCAAPGEMPPEIAASREAAVKSWFGMQLHGSNPEKKIGVLQGATQIGKSQAVEIVCALLGDEIAWPAARPQLLVKVKANRHDAEESQLAGKRMVLVNELDEDQVLDENQVLRLVNPEGTMVSLRKLGHDRVDAVTTWKITATTNQLPQANVTPQIAGRLFILELSRTEIPATERWDIKNAILENEPEAVMAHLVKWWREWYMRWSSPGSETGLVIPVEAVEAVKAYKKANRHPAEEFIEEMLVVEAGAYISSKEVAEYCARYYRIQHEDKSPRYLGGRRKLYALMSAIPGVMRVERPHGDHTTLIGFDGVRLSERFDDELRLLEARGAGRGI